MIGNETQNPRSCCRIFFYASLKLKDADWLHYTKKKKKKGAFQDGCAIFQSWHPAAFQGYASVREVCGGKNINWDFTPSSRLVFQSIGKGSLWSIDPEYRHNLIQALKKTPYHPYSPGLATPSTSPPTLPQTFHHRWGGLAEWLIDSSYDISDSPN